METKMEMKAEKRELAAKKEKGLSVKNILIVVVLIAAGAVLKIFSNTIFSFTPLKPNMVIAMYCLAIMLLRPSVLESAVIGLISGIICMFLPGATPYANVVSELVGGVVICLLVKIPYKLEVKGLSFKVIIDTFIATLCSGYTFFLMLKVLILTGMELNGMAIDVFTAVIFGTAVVNSVIAFILYPILKKVLIRE